MDVFRTLVISWTPARLICSQDDKEDDVDTEEIDADDTPRPVFTDDCEGDYSKSDEKDE